MYKLKRVNLGDDFVSLDFENSDGDKVTLVNIIDGNGEQVHISLEITTEELTKECVKSITINLEG